MSTPVSVPTRGASKWSCDRAKVRPQSARDAICRRPDTTGSPSGGSSFIPLWGFFVFLLYAMRRVDCRRCGVVAVEEVPWGDGKRTLTRAYMLFLARWARRLSWKETAVLSHFLGQGVRCG